MNVSVMQRINKPKVRHEPSEAFLNEIKHVDLPLTPSKLKVLEIFYENDADSLSAYDVYGIGQRKSFKLSMSTIYVSISKLVSHELLAVTMFNGSEKKFRLNKGPRNSVVKCPQCGTFVDFDGASMSSIFLEALTAMNFSIKKCVFSIEALCNRCR